MTMYYKNINKVGIRIFTLILFYFIFFNNPVFSETTPKLALKIDWTRYFPGDSTYARYNSIFLTDTFINAAGYSGNKSHMIGFITFDYNGNKCGQVHHELNFWAPSSDVILRPDNRGIVFHCPYSGNSDSSWLYAMNRNGDIEWEKKNVYKPDNVIGVGLCSMKNGGFGYCGTKCYSSKDSINKRDVFICVYNQDGILSWDTVLGETGMDEGIAIRELANGNLLVSSQQWTDVVHITGGYTGTQVFGLDWFSPSGVHLKSVKGKVFGRAEYNRILEDERGNIYLFGTIDRTVSVRKFTANGDSIWHYLFPKRYNDICVAAAFLGDSLIAVASYLLQVGQSGAPLGGTIHVFNRMGTLLLSKFISDLTPRAFYYPSDIVCPNDTTCFVLGEARLQSLLMRITIKPDQSTHSSLSICPNVKDSRGNLTHKYDIAGRRVTPLDAGEQFLRKKQIERKNTPQLIIAPGLNSLR